MGSVNNWSFVFDNILPYQSFLYHGCLVFLPLYMVISKFYNPRWSDIYKAAVVLIVCAIFAQSLNFILDGSGADFMMLRYGNGNPFASLLISNPFIYYLILLGVAIGGTSLVIVVTISIQKLIGKRSNVSV